MIATYYWNEASYRGGYGHICVRAKSLTAKVILCYPETFVGYHFGSKHELYEALGTFQIPVVVSSRIYWEEFSFLYLLPTYYGCDDTCEFQAWFFSIISNN